MWCVQINFWVKKNLKRRKKDGDTLMLLLSLPFLMFQTSVSICSMSIQPLAPYVLSLVLSFSSLFFYTGLGYIFKDYSCC